jgi:hypothetical protein
MEKSASKRWRESGSSLSFKEWVQRENEKKESNMGSFIENYSIPNVAEIPDLNKRHKNADGKTQTVFGLSKTVLVLSGLLIVGSLGFVYYKKYIKK